MTQWEPEKPLAEIKRPAVNRESLRAYAEASKDLNPIHLDDEFAKKLGFPSVIAHGMLSMAYLADHLQANFSNDRYEVQRLKAKFRKMTYPGDELLCGGEIKKVLDNGSLVVALWAKNQNGEITTEGEAEVAPKA